MLNQTGILKGVRWYVTLKQGKTFTIKVGEKEQEYTCIILPLYGFDVTDVININKLIHELWEENNNDKNT